MSWSLNIGTIAGTAVRVHITFLLFLVWISCASYVAAEPQAAWSGARLHAAAVRLRAGARIRPHLHGARASACRRRT